MKTGTGSAIRCIDASAGTISCGACPPFHQSRIWLWAIAGSLPGPPRACPVGGKAVALESMVETARSKGFHGSLELAAGVLRVSGQFRLEKGPMDKWHAIRQPIALVPVALEPKSTALVRVDARPMRRALAPVAGDRL